jgi:hypothetical protein
MQGNATKRNAMQYIARTRFNFHRHYTATNNIIVYRANQSCTPGQREVAVVAAKAKSQTR